MPTDKEYTESVQALGSVIKEGSPTKAVRAVGKGRAHKADPLDLPPVEKFKKILKRAGASEKFVAESLFDMFQATKVTFEKDGRINEAPDNTIRLKAIEMWLKYFVPQETSKGDNHLHVHGKDAKLDDLLDKARGN